MQKASGQSVASQAKLLTMQSPRSPAMERRMTKGRQDETEALMANGESSNEGYLLEGESSSMQISSNSYHIDEKINVQSFIPI